MCSLQIKPGPQPAFANKVVLEDRPTPRLHVGWGWFSSKTAGLNIAEETVQLTEPQIFIMWTFAEKVSWSMLSAKVTSYPRPTFFKISTLSHLSAQAGKLIHNVFCIPFHD